MLGSKGINSNWKETGNCNEGGSSEKIELWKYFVQLLFPVLGIK